MRIDRICVGRPAPVDFNGKRVSTGIYKYPVDGPVFADRLGLAGDGQADLSGAWR